MLLQALRKNIRFTGRHVMGRRSKAQITQQRLRALARSIPAGRLCLGAAAMQAHRARQARQPDPDGQAGPLPLRARPFQARISVVATRNAIFPGTDGAQL